MTKTFYEWRGNSWLLMSTPITPPYVYVEMRATGLTLYAQCFTCGSSNVFDNHWDVADTTHFYKPTNLLKHLMDHKLAGHNVPNELFETVHEWLSYIQRDRF